MGEKLKNLRKSRFKENPKRFNYCRSQETFAENFGCGRETIVNWENNNTSPSLKDFIEICQKLECEPNYLLISKSIVKSQAINLISQVLGISTISAERIEQNAFLAQLLNHFIGSTDFIQLTDNIHEFVLTEYISKEIFQKSFDGNFRNELEAIFANFYYETFPLDRNEECFQSYLKQKIPFNQFKNNNENFKNLDIYLKRNLSPDTYNQIYLKYEKCTAKTAEALYKIFIEDTAWRTYDILLNKHIRDVQLTQITQAIANLLTSFQYKSVTNNSQTKKKEQKIY